jgi:hypothetical protein
VSEDIDEAEVDRKPARCEKDVGVELVRQGSAVRQRDRRRRQSTLEALTQSSSWSQAIRHGPTSLVQAASAVDCPKSGGRCKQEQAYSIVLDRLAVR